MVGAAIITALLSVYFDISIKMSRELRTYGANFFIGPNVSSGVQTIDQRIFEDIISEIPADGLIGVSPYIYGVVRLDLGNTVMAGVNFSELKKLSPYWQVEGRWISVDFDERNCMIGKTLAKNMELKVGDEVNVLKIESGFLRTLIIKGIVETGQAEDEQIFVNLSLAQKILGLRGKVNHGLLSVVAQAMDIDAFASHLERRFQEIDARPIRKISYSEGKILGKIKGLMALVAVIILTVTTLCVMTTLMAVVAERTREIGLMKALGADNGSIVLQFLSETGFIGLSGATTGIVTGFILAQILGQAVFSSFIEFRVIVFPVTLAISIAAAMVAAAIPVRMAVKVVPAQVLKGE
jgi:putative ABC transport system permease protein